MEECVALASATTMTSARKSPERGRRIRGAGCGHDTVVTLVHGTWARNATWMDESSALRQELLKQIPAISDILVFRWTGRNSHAARLDAASRLCEHHAAVKKMHPRASHYVIAHSHGGNVALYAYRHPEFKDVAGVACLSTPFLHVRTRGFEALWLVMWMLSCVFIAALVFAPLAAAWLSTHNIPVNVAELSSWLAIMFALGVLYVAWGEHSQKNSIRLGVMGGAEPQELRDLNLLIIRSSADEASATLAVMQFVTWLAEKAYWLLDGILLKLPGLLYSRVERFRIFQKYEWGAFPIPVALFALGSTVVTTFLLSQLNVPTTFWGWPVEAKIWLFERAVLPFYGYGFAGVGHFAIWIILVLAAGLTVLLGVLGVIALFLSVLLNVSGMPFGFYTLWEAFPPMLSAEVCPPGTWVVHQLRKPSPKPYQDAKAGMAHSEPYSDPESLALIADFVHRSPGVTADQI